MTTEWTVAGLDREVEILVDEWGVPHLYAESVADLHLAQGFNAARDRLFQIDLWRRRGLGRLSEVLGSAYLDQDRARRLFMYRGPADVEWAAYGEGTEAAIRSFIAGVNAYVRWVREHPDALPPEFSRFDYLPDEWEAEDVVRVRSHGLYYNAEQEIARARTLLAGGEEADRIRQAREPEAPIALPDGLVLEDLDVEDLAVLRLALAPVAFDRAVADGAWRASISGSNNWVIAPDRTSTGRPILANDPHRAVTLPSLRYVAHLSAPGLDVIGAGEPALPGISIGHNGRVAFGLTIWPIDQEDVYVYELDETGTAYRYGDGWEPFDRVEETIAARGDAASTVELLFTRHGPVLRIDRGARRAVALRAAWLLPGMAAYVGSLAYQDARDGAEFVAALERWGAPGVNQLYATVDGDVGWQACGLVPSRAGWDGSLPVPGDGRFEWDGFVRAPHLPSSHNPEAGWLQTANEMNLPADYDGPVPTHDWYSSSRAERLADWLASTPSSSVADSVRMQSDAVTAHGRRVVDLLASVDPASVGEGELFSELLAWDGEMHVGSRPAVVFEVWVRRHLRPALTAAHLRSTIEPERVDELVRLIDKDESFGGDLRGELRMLAALGDGDLLTTLVDRTLTEAAAALTNLLGPDRSAWTWGALHHTLLTNPAFVGADAPQEWAQVGPASRGGNGDSVGNAGYDRTFRQTIGSTFRMVVDVGEWDRSRAVNAPGQSGDPRSPHYSDLFDDWIAGESFPLLYSRGAVEAHTRLRIVLRPA